MTQHPAKRYSIVIATRDRPKQLRKCLESIVAIDYSRDRFEVMVVDDGSLTPTDALIAQFSGSFNLLILRQENQGPAAARNLGVRRASGEYVVFTDDDCELTPDIFEFLDQQFAMTPTAMIGGHTINVLSDNPFAVASQTMIDIMYNYYDDGHHPHPTLASNNMALPREEFLNIGGFNARMSTAAEDRELCDTWIGHGHPVRYVARTMVRHAHDLSLTGYLRQHFAYGRGGFAFHACRRSTLPLKLRVHWGFYTPERWFWYPLSQGKGWQKPVVVMAVWLGHAAEFFGFIVESHRHRRSDPVA